MILLNFHPWDLWLTLKYKRGTRKDTKEVLADVKDWTDKLRNVYKKEGEPLKWIRRIEIGAQGGDTRSYSCEPSKVNADNRPYNKKTMGQGRYQFSKPAGRRRIWTACIIYMQADR